MALMEPQGNRADHDVPELEPANEVKQILEMLGMGDEGEPVEF